MKGVCITLCEAQRNKQDERRYGPRGEESTFQGAVMSKRKPRINRAQQVEDKEKDEAEAFPMDMGLVLSKRPDARLRWLQRGLTFAAKKHVQPSALFDIAINKKFVSGVSAGSGIQMRSMLMANLHLFSSKQQRLLQSDLSPFHQFGIDASDSESGSARGRNASRSRSRAGSANAGRRSPSPVGHKAAKAFRFALDIAGTTPRGSALTELQPGNSNPLRQPPMVTSRGFVSRYPFPLPDIVPGEDVRKYAFGTADDFLAAGDDAAAASRASASKGNEGRGPSQPRSPSRTPTPEPGAGIWQSQEVLVKGNDDDIEIP